MKIFLCALGLMLVFEGVSYFAFPAHMRVLAAKIPELPDRVLRSIGFAAMAIGLLIVYLAQGGSGG